MRLMSLQVTEQVGEVGALSPATSHLEASPPHTGPASMGSRGAGQSHKQEQAAHRYLTARGVFQEPNTALMASRICS